jgi:hypothetical protein
MTENITDKTDKTDNITKPWQFQKGQSGNPSGRPKSTFNQSTQMIKDLLLENSEALIRKMIELALDGDMTALKICIDRICPPLKAQSQAVNIDYNQEQGLTQTAKHILEQVTQGIIPPDIGSQLINSIITITRTKDIEEIQKRIEAIEISFIEGKTP